MKNYLERGRGKSTWVSERESIRKLGRDGIQSMNMKKRKIEEEEDKQLESLCFVF